MQPCGNITCQEHASTVAPRDWAGAGDRDWDWDRDRDWDWDDRTGF